MRYRLFQYPLPAPDELDELNAFLGSQRVAMVTHHVVQNASGAMLLFVVEHVDDGAKSPSARTPKVDYREQLSEADFAVFSRLRDERKKLAEAEGVPVYTIFSNAHLAEMVTRRVRTAAEMAKIEGIGNSRVEKYSDHMLPILADREPKSEPTGGA